MNPDHTLGEQCSAVPHQQSDFTRLHITPFDSELLKIVIPPYILPNARNLSFHIIETFPEKRFGYVDLPVADAEKLKKKLNGAVLKGCKMRIEKAKQEWQEEPHGQLEKKEKKKKSKSKSKEAEDDHQESTEKSKKRKRDEREGVVEGLELDDRKVKRGWTEVPGKEKKKRRDKSADKDGDKDKKKEKKARVKSKYTDGEECLLKTRVPPNSTKYLNDEDAAKKKKRKGKAREVTVHEFEKTTKFPTFLKDSGGDSSRKTAKEFIEGKGWVDEDWNVIEAVKEEKKPLTEVIKAKVPKATATPKKPVVEEDSDGTSSSGTSSDDDDDESSDEESSEYDTPKKKTPVTKETATSTKSKAAAESEDSDSSSDDDEPKEQITPKPQTSRPISSSSNMSLTIKIPPPDVVPSTTTTEVHPLEALYKKKKPEETTIVTNHQTPAKQAFSFSFTAPDDDDDYENNFDNGDEDENQDQLPPMPMTPFTRQDLELRNIRSAAPTPDTAHPSRRQWLSHSDDDNNDDDVLEDDDLVEMHSVEGDGNNKNNEDTEGKGKANASTDFQSWFWENRRDLNKSWMTRRKAAAKEKRHRENKARASRAV